VCIVGAPAASAAALQLRQLATGPRARAHGQLRISLSVGGGALAMEPMELAETGCRRVVYVYRFGER